MDGVREYGLRERGVHVIAALRTALRDERGLGLPIAMGVLVVVLLLSGVAVTTSQQSHRASEKDRKAKRALGPADAAIQGAAWRLAQRNTLGAVPNDRCFVSGNPNAIVQPSGAAPCPAPQTISLGNGAEYSYVASAVLAPGSTCGGDTIVAGSFERCVTATGTANGVSRRVQTRLSAAQISLFPPRGLVVQEALRLNNGIDFYTCPGDPTGTVGTNGSIWANQSINFRTACGGGQPQTWTISQAAGQTATFAGTNPNNPTVVTPPGGTFTFPPIAPWPDPPTPVVSNATIPTGGGVTYSAATKILSITGGTLTLQAGTYVFCGIDFGLNGSIQLAAGAQVKIYIDSPFRSGNPSGCGAGTGYLHTQNGANINWGGSPLWNQSSAEVAAAAQNLHIYVYGRPGETMPVNCSGGISGTTVAFCQSTRFAGVLYAPQSMFHADNSVQVVGAIAARQVYANNTISFRFPPGLNDGLAGNPGVYGDAKWTECTSTPPSADPHSGCG